MDKYYKQFISIKNKIGLFSVFIMNIYRKWKKIIAPI
jgi:hypothetical protein